MRTITDDWPLLCQFLPEDWQSMAWSLGAMRRARAFPGPAQLLRTLLVHLAAGCSLRETALRASQAGWGAISAVALFKRLQASEQWLRWMAEQLWRQAGGATVDPPDVPRIRAVDATTIQEPGSTGTDWRVHLAINLADLQCDFLEVTDVRGGETFRRIPVAPGDLLLGDRAYGTPPGIAHVKRRRASVPVRVNQKALPLYDRRQQPFPLLDWLRTLPLGQTGEAAAWVHPKGERIGGRLVALRRDPVAAEGARRRARRRASRKQQSVSAEALEAAGYVFLWSDLPRRRASAASLLELYRSRWQIELAFKRMKSILGLGALPKHAAASCRAWIHGKLLLALLVERLLASVEDVPPSGGGVGAEAEPLA